MPERDPPEPTPEALPERLPEDPSEEVPGYLPPHPDDPEITGKDPAEGPQPVRSTLQAIVMLLLGAISLGVLVLAVVALLR